MSARATCRCGWTGRYSSPAKAEASAARHVCKADDAVRRLTRQHRCARCGFTAVYDNAGATEARYWFSKHSCQKRERAMLRTALAEQREALVDRTPKPCLHKVASHQHGTRACYVLDRCRCLPCAQENTRTANERTRLKAYGRYNRYVPSLPVREHVNSLTAAGMGLKQVAKVSGVSHGCLWKLMYGKRQSDGAYRPSARVLRETAEKLYAIDTGWSGRLELAGGAKDPEGTPLARRRLQSLVALGWSMSEIGRRLGIRWAGNACNLVAGTDRNVTMQRRTVDAATSLFEQLCMTPPPETNRMERVSASRARRYAFERGWLPPLALDDEPIEDTVEDALDDIDEVAIQRRMDGDRLVQLTKAEATELVRRWRASDRPLNECARVTGLKPERYYRPAERQVAS